MTYADKIKLERLMGTFELNFKLTRLYANYLNIIPDAITREIIYELCADGEITEKEAIVALLCELFGIDRDRSAEDRRLISEYLNESVRILDVKKYTENPYYKNVAPREARHGSVEIRWQTYPPYRAAICDDLIIREDYTEVPVLGFFREEFPFPSVMEDGNEWMTLTPVDIDTCEEAIERAHGRVLTFGLGLGYYAYMASEKEEVESVTVVEKNEAVISLFNSHILPAFSHPEKIRIVCADALEYADTEMAGGEFDYAFVDIWRDAHDGAPFYVEMKKREHLTPKTRFDYWIERFLISRIRAERYGELCEKYESNAPDAPESYDEFIRRLCE